MGLLEGAGVGSRCSSAESAVAVSAATKTKSSTRGPESLKPKPRLDPFLC